MSDETRPEPDRAEGAPHPRETLTLFGQRSAQAGFLDAYNRGKLHHGWLLTGPRGVGKATLAWRIARFLLTQEVGGDAGLFGEPEKPATLDVDPNHPAVRRARALGEPRLFLLRRGWDDKARRLKTVITVDEVRKLKSFFTLSAADGGWRVAIVDAADEMNPNAANALLKLLEEPPENTVLLLVAHQPARLLPTIRSRCRALRCDPLSAADQAAALDAAGIPAQDTTALAELSSGSVGAAVRLLQSDGLALYAQLVEVLSAAPGLDRTAALRLADACAGAANAERYDMTLTLLAQLLTRLARFGARQPATWDEAAPHEARLFARLAPNARAARGWADLAAGLSARTGHARAVNIDPSTTVLDTLLSIDATARGAAA